MNDFSELEAELKQLRPVAPAPDLMARVERALETAQSTVPSAGVLPRRTARMNWYAIGLGLAAAAVLIVAARINLDRPAAPKVSQLASATPAAAQNIVQPGFLPDGVTRVVYDTRNEGLLFPTNSEQPVRRVRSRSRETVKWRDPSSGASLRVSYPTEDVRLIPVSGQ